MYLFERITNMLEYKGFSRAKLSKKLDIPPNTFGRYFTPEQQDKLAPHLWKILEFCPDVSRDWLFFGEGEMLSKNQVTSKDAEALKEQVQELEKELKESYRHNQQLTAKLFIEGSPNSDTGQSSNG